MLHFLSEILSPEQKARQDLSDNLEQMSENPEWS